MITMNPDLSTKLSQVIEQIPKDVLYDFLRSYYVLGARGRIFERIGVM